MQTWIRGAAFAAAVVGLAGFVQAGADQPAPPKAIQSHAFAILTPEDQARVLAAGAYMPDDHADEPISPATDEQYEIVRGIVSREVFDSMRPGQRLLLQRILFMQSGGQRPPSVCFAPGTSAEIMRAFERARFPALAMRYQQGPRWVLSATNPGPLVQGDRVTLRYSFVPDGTPVDGSNSNLFARMNAIYPGGPAVWQPLYHQVFARWAELCGVLYVHETNDDGAPFGAAGAIGVRGDVRISGIAIDGNGGILAYNYFPDEFDGIGGDMVIDSNDSFYNDTSSNSLPLRNVLAHEHGHGLGMPHVCPNIQTKLLEPFISTVYDGPQLDDILNAQRNYGDPLEPSDSVAAAATISGAGASVQTIPFLSVDGTSDQDFYRFPAVPANSLLRVVVTPLGFRYSETFQNGGGAAGCVSPGTSIDPSRFRQLTVQIRNGAGTIQSSVTNTLGLPITALHTATSTADLLLEVVGDGTDEVQAYSLAYQVVAASPALEIFPAAPLPTQLSTSASTTFNMRTTTSGTLAGNPTMFYRFSPAASFSAVVMSPMGAANAWTASVPAAPCVSSPQVYFSAQAGLTTATYPAGAPGTVLNLTVQRPSITIFTDDFSTDKGWAYGQPGDTATTGQWQRGDPAASSAQTDAANSGTLCAVTGIGTPGDGAGVHDIDNGFTRLLSPAFNLASTRDAIISYARWYSNSGGAAPSADIFTVQVSSDNGGSWSTLEIVGPGGTGTHGGWVVASIPLPAAVARTAQMRLRFTAEDAASGSLVEAALDDVSITASLSADFNSSNTVTVQDLFDFLAAWFAPSLSADFNKSGSVTVQDLFDFLAVWFSQC